MPYPKECGVTPKVGLLAMKKKIRLDMSVIDMYVCVCISDSKLPITLRLPRARHRKKYLTLKDSFSDLCCKSHSGEITRYGSLESLDLFCLTDLLQPQGNNVNYLELIISTFEWPHH